MANAEYISANKFPATEKRQRFEVEDKSFEEVHTPISFEELQETIPGVADCINQGYKQFQQMVQNIGEDRWDRPSICVVDSKNFGTNMALDPSDDVTMFYEPSRNALYFVAENTKAALDSGLGDQLSEKIASELLISRVRQETERGVRIGFMELTPPIAKPETLPFGIYKWHVETEDDTSTFPESGAKGGVDTPEDAMATFALLGLVGAMNSPNVDHYLFFDVDESGISNVIPVSKIILQQTFEKAKVQSPDKIILESLMRGDKANLENSLLAKISRLLVQYKGENLETYKNIYMALSELMRGTLSVTGYNSGGLA